MVSGFGGDVSSLAMIVTPAFALLLTITMTSLAQTALPPETHQFDFWIGKWKCSGESFDANGKSTRTEATNSIERTFDGHVIRENFKMRGLNGTSVSVFDPAAKLWRQTWVDDQGSYIALAGTCVEGKMTLQTLPRPDRPKAASRMVFSNVAADSFDWDWQSSRDAGATWTLVWHLHYVRVKK